MAKGVVFFAYQCYLSMTERRGKANSQYRACDVDRDGIVSLMDIISHHHRTHAPEVLKSIFDGLVGSDTSVLSEAQYSTFLTLLEGTPVTPKVASDSSPPVSPASSPKNGKSEYNIY
jgi:hypothetical protein